MKGFRSGQISVLVATDVVGRGIDVEGISHVINYDMPDDPENYVHRIGRTGRMGKDGVAYLFVCPDQGEPLTAIENLVNRVIPSLEIEGFSRKPKKSRAGRARAVQHRDHPVAFDGHALASISSGSLHLTERFKERSGFFQELCGAERSAALHHREPGRWKP